jgi:hypothetical protein
VLFAPQLRGVPSERQLILVHDYRLFKVLVLFYQQTLSTVERFLGFVFAMNLLKLPNRRNGAASWHSRSSSIFEVFLCTRF